MFMSGEEPEVKTHAFKIVTELVTFNESCNRIRNPTLVSVLRLRLLKEVPRKVNV